MTKQLEDYKDLSEWCDNHLEMDLAQVDSEGLRNKDGVGNYYPADETESKLLELAQQLEQLEKEKLESIDAWNSQLEKASAKIKQLEQENKELQDQSDIFKNQMILLCNFYRPSSSKLDIAQEQLAQHDKEVAVKAIEGLMDYIEAHGFKSVQRAVVIKYLEQLKEGDQ